MNREREPQVDMHIDMLMGPLKGFAAPRFKNGPVKPVKGSMMGPLLAEALEC